MDDIQKAIDEGKAEFEGISYYAYTPEQLKSLLEQVAKEAFMEGAERGFRYDTPNFIQWWEAKNLTFNED